MPTPDHLAVIRSWCGSTTGTSGDLHDSSDLDARMSRLGSPEAVSLEILRERRADMLSNPLSFQVQGDYSEDRAENLRALDVLIGQLERLVGAPSVSVSKLRRPGRAR